MVINRKNVKFGRGKAGNFQKIYNKFLISFAHPASRSCAQMLKDLKIQQSFLINHSQAKETSWFIVEQCKIGSRETQQSYQSNTSTKKILHVTVEVRNQVFGTEVVGVIQKYLEREKSQKAKKSNLFYSVLRDRVFDSRINSRFSAVYVMNTLPYTIPSW